MRLWWRAVTETVADLHYQRRGFGRSLLRVLAAAPAAWLHGLRESLPNGQDARIALRRVRRSPGYLVFASLTLAVAIGSTTAVYSVIEAALYRQQPIPQLDEIVNIYQKNPADMPPSTPSLALSAHDVADLTARQHVFSAIAAWTRFSAPIVSGTVTESVIGEAVSADYFSLLGVTPSLGRLLIAADQAPGAPPVVVLSDSFWRRAFGADPAVIGTSVRIRGALFRIVGVAPAWFRGSDVPNLLPTPAWVALPHGDAARTGAASPFDRRELWVKARLKPGVTLDDARNDVRLVSQQIATADPDRRASRDQPGQPPRGWYVMRMSDLRMHESVHALSAALAGALSVMVTLVLLVACSNLTNLTLARTARRRRDLGVSLALGASRIRLARETMLETGIVAVLGWGLGLLLALAIMRFFASPVTLHGAAALTLKLSPQLNVPVLLASLAATGAAIVVVGLVPALRQSRLDIRDAVLSEGAASSPRWRGRAILIAVQVSVSMVLLALSVTSVRSLGDSLAHDPGFALDELAQLTLDFTSSSDTPARRVGRAQAVAEALGRVPGVANVALSTGLPLGSAPHSLVFVTTSNSESATAVQARRVAAAGAVFGTLGIRTVAGSAWHPSVAAPADGQVFVSASFAERMYPDGAIGRPVWIRSGFADQSQTRRPATIAGVVADTDTVVFGDSGRGMIVYESLPAADEPAFSIVVRSSGVEPSRLLPSLRAAAIAADPELPIASVATGMDVGGPAVLALKLTGGIVGTLGSFALLMAVTGLFGVLTDVVSRRTHEIGVRMALGAGRRSIRRMVILDGLRPVAVGVAIGGAASWWLLQAVPVMKFMWRVRPDVAVPMLGAIALLASAAAIACYLPAARASRLDPNVALRDL